MARMLNSLLYRLLNLNVNLESWKWHSERVTHLYSSSVCLFVKWLVAPDEPDGHWMKCAEKERENGSTADKIPREGSAPTWCRRPAAFPHLSDNDRSVTCQRLGGYYLWQIGIYHTTAVPPIFSFETEICNVWNVEGFDSRLSNRFHKILEKFIVVPSRRRRFDRFKWVKYSSFS